MIGAKKLQGGGAKQNFPLRAKLLPPSDQNPVYAPEYNISKGKSLTWSLTSRERLVFIEITLT